MVRNSSFEEVRNCAVRALYLAPQQLVKKQKGCKSSVQSLNLSLWCLWGNGHFTVGSIESHRLNFISLCAIRPGILWLLERWLDDHMTDTDLSFWEATRQNYSWSLVWKIKLAYRKCGAPNLTENFHSTSDKSIVSVERPELWRVSMSMTVSSVFEHLELCPRHLSILVCTRCSISWTDFVADNVTPNLLNQGRLPLEIDDNRMIMWDKERQMSTTLTIGIGWNVGYESVRPWGKRSQDIHCKERGIP